MINKCAALYLRVSTVRQAENDLSIPDQRNQCASYCKINGLDIVSEFVEPGATATDDKRQAFQEMIDISCGSDCPFEIIVVHSFSRFFRDAFKSEFYIRKLIKAGVRLVSVTQEFGDDPTSQLIRQIVALFDEYQSRENSKHTLRAMRENARQGFWNGATPPLGYRVVATSRRGDKIKKSLEIDYKEAEIIRLIFQLYLRGVENSGQIGIKSIASYLNERNYRLRRGGRFSTKTVHEILRRSTYCGRHFFNKTNSKTRRTKPREEWIEMSVPPIIEESSFDQVQLLMKKRSPRNTPPRITNGPTLLTGIAKCSACGGGMTLRTGKSGRYRYYTCSRSSRQGKSACKGLSVPMKVLDDIVTNEVAARVLEPNRIRHILEELLLRTSNEAEKLQDRRVQLEARKCEIDSRLKRLYEAVEDGIVPIGNSFKERINNLDAEKNDVMSLLEKNARSPWFAKSNISQTSLNAFSDRLRHNIYEGSPAFRKAYIRLLVEGVEVDDTNVRIWGRKEAILSALNMPDSVKADMVPSFVQDWRPLRDSNPCFRRERAAS